MPFACPVRGENGAFESMVFNDSVSFSLKTVSLAVFHAMEISLLFKQQPHLFAGGVAVLKERGEGRGRAVFPRSAGRPCPYEKRKRNA